MIRKKDVSRDLIWAVACGLGATADVAIRAGWTVEDFSQAARYCFELELARYMRKAAWNRFRTLNVADAAERVRSSKRRRNLRGDAKNEQA